VWALLKVSEKRGLDLSDNDIAEDVEKVGGGHPSKQAIAELRARIAADPQWYPGKKSEDAKKPGRKPLLTEAKKLAIARSAMALKAAGEEPSVPTVLDKCPRAAINPDTNEPFTKKYILQVFRSHCFDPGSDVPWDHQAPLQKTALPDYLKGERLGWGRIIKALGHTAGWYAQNCIWADPCSTIVPGAPRAAFDQNQAQYGKSKRWVSKDKRVWSRNQRAAPYAGKQAHWGDKRVYWFIIVARGKVRMLVMPDGWKQTGEGMAAFVNQLEGALTKMLGPTAPKPRVLFTDRGPGFYQSSEGGIVKKYKAALDEHGFRPFAGENAKWQPTDCPDVFPHETAVAWVRQYFSKHPHSVRDGLEANHQAFLENLRDAEKHINQNHDVAALCASFLSRIETLIQKKGERLKS